MSEQNLFDSNRSPYKSPDFPMETRSTEPAESIGGWLILLAIGLVLAPIGLGVVIFTIHVPIYMDGTWEALTTPGAENYHPLWASYLIFELLVNVALMVGYLGLAIIFFRRSRFFPRAYIAISLISFAMLFLDGWFGSFIITDEPMFSAEMLKNIVRSLISMLIWCPYLLVSERSRRTFVR